MSSRRELHELDPNTIADHLGLLYRVARSLCASREDAEDLVQDTLAAVLSRRRLLHNDDARGYLIRALRNTHATRRRASRCRPATVPLLDGDLDDRAYPDPPVGARELMEAIVSAPRLYREAVLAVDVVGLSYREAAHRLRTREATITTRLHRGRRHLRGLLGAALP